ncbi:cupin domain-containing protein [Emticicia sp. TH156]|uniref:cupin domain-containing protein n=1 Tax=Emticicia sp. TH156 TaxID=2067454 RepID=UPI000C78FE92|nr:cupin domain-containing protein [Emticicia sp. TH156]PLK44928.1 cupin domain-containing protein [Emticicia sp. TH156]
MNRKTPLLLMAFSVIGIISCQRAVKYQQNNRLFDKGSRVTNNNFIGVSWLNTLVEADTSNHIQVGSVTFEPGARTNWHYHPGGQILLIIDGKGLYQERGKPVEIIKKGDVRKCPPNIHHWHGATLTDTLVQVAVTNNINGRVVWLEPVSEDDYKMPVKGVE